MSGRSEDVASLVEAAAGEGPGRARAVARLLSLVEGDSDQLHDVARAVVGRGDAAHVIGLTGAPGVGKSTSTAAVVTALRARGRRVGVLAVDPSSPYSGGALLGDRVRMNDHATDPGVLIRSMASRGHLGGLAAAAPLATRILAAAGCEVVLVETVGVGQSEVEVAGLADTTVVLSAPGMGDGIQAAKAGILEIGDVFVVNKADREGSAATRRELRAMVAAGHRSPESWRPPVVATVATTGAGVDDLVEAVEAHHAHLAASGEGAARRLDRTRREVEALALGSVSRRFAHLAGDVRLDDLAAAVVAGRLDPYTAAARLVDGL